METQWTPPDSLDHPPPAEAGQTARTTTRRGFLNQAGRKARYIAPLILTLTVAQARADGSGIYCKVSGDDCTTDGECCSKDCQDLGQGLKCQ